MVSFSVPWFSSGSNKNKEKVVTAESSSADIAAAATGLARTRLTAKLQDEKSEPVATADGNDGDSSNAIKVSPKTISTLARKDAETPYEREKRIRALFERMDISRSGFLRPIDIEEGVGEITGQSYGAFAASELIRVADRTKDGIIDYDEFRAFIERKERALRQIFDEMDVSHDEALQSNELKESLQRAGITVSDADVDRFMRLLDTNGDGSIQFDEWRNFLVFLPREINLSNIYRHLRSMAQITSDGEVIITSDVATKSVWTHLIAGATAGTISRTTTAPLDRLKIYLQTHRPQPGQGNPLVNGIRELYTSGGIRNFFRGNGLNVLKIAPETGIKFLTYDRCKRLFGAGQFNSDGTPVELGLISKFMAGGTAGVISQGSIYPLETLKTRMMASSGVSASSGVVSSNVMLRVAGEMWREAGLRAYYRGVVPSLVGVFPFAAIDLACFETLKTAYIKRGQAKMPANEPFEPSVLGTLICGMISGTTGAVAVYPLSLVRTRLQAQGTPGHPRTYSGAFDVVRVTLQREGIRGFYKGLVPTLVKVVPAVGISYTVYEKTKNYFD